MSNITFDEFNKEFEIISTEEHCKEQFQRYSDCIKNININFKYPHYYNGVIAFLLLFSNDWSYDLSDHAYFQCIFREAKELAILGYTDFEGFDMDSLNLLISSLRQMSYIFRAQQTNYRSVILNTNDTTMAGCFEDKNGTLIQIKPIDFSKSNSNEIKKCHLLDISQHIPIIDTIDCNAYINHMSIKFEMAWASVSSGCGFFIDICIGKRLNFSISTSRLNLSYVRGFICYLDVLI